MNEKGKGTNKLEKKEKGKSRGDSGKRKTEEKVEKKGECGQQMHHKKDDPINVIQMIILPVLCLNVLGSILGQNTNLLRLKINNKSISRRKKKI